MKTAAQKSKMRLGKAYIVVFFFFTYILPFPIPLNKSVKNCGLMLKENKKSDVFLFLKEFLHGKKAPTVGSRKQVFNLGHLSLHKVIFH